MKAGHIIADVPETPLINKPLLSVIVPLTRMAGRLANLETWLSESFGFPISIVIVHDIRDPYTGIELEELVRNYNHLDIEVIEGIFGAPGLARNAGLESPLATWTTFWDADDLPNPHEVFAAIAQAGSDTEVVIGNFTINTAKGSANVEHDAGINNVAFNPGLWRMIFRSSILEGASFSSARMGEDQLFLIDLNLGSRNICFSNKFVYQYFQGDPMQLTSNQESINEVEETLTLVSKRMKNDDKLKNVFSQIVLMRLLTTTVMRTKSSSRLNLVIRHTPTIFQLSPRAAAVYFISFRKVQAKR